MPNCNCFTQWYTTYYKWTYFWEFDTEKNKNIISILENDFATWLQLTEQSFRDQEYDRSELRPYSCQSNSVGSRDCSCYFYNKLTFKNQDGELYPIDNGGLNEDPEAPPDPVLFAESSPQGIGQLNPQCMCTSTLNGSVSLEVPDTSSPSTSTIIDRKTFPKDITYKFKADKFIEIGCKDNKAPAHMQYKSSLTEVTEEFKPGTASFHYLLRRQITKIKKYYRNNHTC